MKRFSILFFTILLSSSAWASLDSEAPESQLSEDPIGTEAAAILTESIKKARDVASDFQKRINDEATQIEGDVIKQARNKRISWNLNRMANILRESNGANTTLCHQIPDVYDSYVQSLFYHVTNCTENEKQKQLPKVAEYNKTVNRIDSQRKYLVDIAKDQVRRCREHVLLPSHIIPQRLNCNENILDKIRDSAVFSELKAADTLLRAQMESLRTKMEDCSPSPFELFKLNQTLDEHEKNFELCVRDKML